LVGGAFALGSAQRDAATVGNGDRIADTIAITPRKGEHLTGAIRRLLETVVGSGALRALELAEGEGIEPSPFPGRGFRDRLSTMDATLLGGRGEDRTRARRT
jgi:hypothetical protein